MSECTQPYYLLNGEIRQCDSFDIQLINKGLSIYEVVRLMDSRLLFMEDHLKRYYSSIELAGLPFFPDEEQILTDLKVLLEQIPVREGNIKMVLNVRDDGSRNFLLYFVRHRYPSAEDYRNGVKVITYPFEREEPNKKIWRPGFRRAVAEILKGTSAYEALLKDTSGYIREASKANVFAVAKGILLTPPDNMILPGITRNYIKSICREMGITIQYQKIGLADLSSFEAMFLSGTSTKVLPVSHVDDNTIPTQNELMMEIAAKYDNAIQEYLKTVNHI